LSYDIYGRRKDDNRVRISNIAFTGSSSNSRDFPRCTICLEQWRLHIENSPDGKKIGVCKRGCGNTFNLEEARNEETGGKRYVAKYPAVTKSFILSKDKKKRKPSELSEEDKSDLAGLSSIGAGARLVEERTTYTDEQGGTY
jgi:hypothetical protein